MTSYLIVDTSFTIRATLPSVEQQTYIELITQWKAAGQQLCAPTLWLYEVASTFTKMAHFKQLSWEDSQKSMRFALQLGVQLIEPDVQLAMRAWTWTHRLQRATAYDSFYLALAEKLGGELWTADKKLFRATAQSWVKMVETD